MKIPKIIHQIWVGNNPKPVKLMQTWKDKHPDYQFVEWNNATVEFFKNASFFKCKKQLDQMLMLGRWNGASDIIRYEVLKRFGGFVAPADSVCLNPIDDLLDLDCFCCYENEKARPGLLSPHIGACPHNPLLDFLVFTISLTNDVLYDEPWKVTGNALLTGAVEKFKFPIHVLPSHTFIPEHYTGEKYEGKEKVYARHFWGSTKRISHKLDEQIK